MSHDRFAPLTPGVLHPADRDPRAWVAPTVATVLLTVLEPVALLVGAMSAMATDSCGPDDCSQDLMTALDVVHWTMLFGGILTLCAWLTSWVLPWKPRWLALRVAAAFLSLVPPLFLILLVFNLPKG
ncbi:hypothetical protein WJ438_22555 [Streptomyces sp. GD-15H]|uniref:hypothetical protein n=1 Tax=Streptomyces sp. GD-15H TaxID=3129112 RepID=UPI0032491063